MDLLFSILTILAIIIGPLIAVQITRYLDGQKEKRNRRLWIFETLMSTRAARLSHDHIRSLNLVGLFFKGKEESNQEVINAWHDYIDTLNNPPAHQVGLSPAAQQVEEKHQDERLTDLLSQLLYVMAKALGHHLDKVHIKKAGYYPLGHARMEDDQRAVLFYLRQVLENNRGIPLCEANHLAVNAAKKDDSETQGGG